MITAIEQERREHEEIQKRMIAVAKRMLASKRELQQEIREDMKKPEIREAIDELKKRNAERSK
ncbi:hypothetical protein [Spirosoma foliorum]|uniref:Uncharacterized protein n=1 Tax=Spirosoma foliorum TaxID=2710596 RepID=A0A7G5GQK6_9BACT|nr:hypothetical protein [Spirosoma foliorum]QMW01148.1 hypothetical protein H3H32_24685 [Spirosoma foliorum]